MSSLLLIQSSSSQVPSPISRGAIFEPTTWKVFVGGSFEREASQNFSGWSTSVSEYPYREHSWVGATVEGAGAYESTSGLSPRLYRIMGGPSVAIRTGRVQPFAHAVFGEVIERESLRRLGSSASGNVNSLGLAAGGGADFAITSVIGVRAQAEWVRNGTGTAIYGFRTSFGVVFGF